jgi:hypothetical protein
MIYIGVTLVEDGFLVSSLIFVLIIQAKNEIANKYNEISPNLLSIYQYKLDIKFP